MEPAEDAAAAAAAAAPDSWETADIDGPMSRLILTARRVSSSPDLAEEQQDPPPAPPQTQGPAPAGDDSVAQVDQFLREALEKPRERLSGKKKIEPSSSRLLAALRLELICL